MANDLEIRGVAQAEPARFLLNPLVQPPFVLADGAKRGVCTLNNVHVQLMYSQSGVRLASICMQYK
jgi:hypothetical protein